MARRYAFLGPVGTFTETALRQVPEAEGAEYLPCPNVVVAMDAVREGEADAAMVPMENSVEGGVSATLDGLTSGDPLLVVREVVVPVSFVLAARPGTRLEHVRRVSTHPHAYAQCRGWLAENLPDAVYVPGLSTAAAAEGLRHGVEDPGYQAALCAPIAAEQYGLQARATAVGDNPNAVTRFVLVARPGPLPEPTGADKTTVVLCQSVDHPGGLLALLEQFAARGINLVRLESRPTGDALGQYSFAIDAEGHVAEARVAEALMSLHRVCREVRFLGSYPAADRTPQQMAPGTSDHAFAEARDWLEQIRAGQVR